MDLATNKKMKQLLDVQPLQVCIKQILFIFNSSCKQYVVSCLSPFVAICTLETPEGSRLDTFLPQRNTDISDIGLNSWRVRKIGKELEKLNIV